MRCQLVFVFAVVLSTSAQYGQVDITLKALIHSSIDEHAVFDMTKLNIRKFNRTTQMLKGEFDILVDFDNNVSVRLAYKLGGILLNLLSTTRLPQMSTRSKATSGE
jgi:hypothetical protein